MVRNLVEQVQEWIVAGAVLVEQRFAESRGIELAGELADMAYCVERILAVRRW